MTLTSSPPCIATSSAGLPPTTGLSLPRPRKLRWRELDADDQVAVAVTGQWLTDTTLEAIAVRDSTSDQTRTEPAAALFVLIGADPHSDWLADTVERDAQGFLLTDLDVVNWPLDRPPLSQESSTPGVFAAGDVRHGSVKRVASEERSHCDNRGKEAESRRDGLPMDQLCRMACRRG